MSVTSAPLDFLDVMTLPQTGTYKFFFDSYRQYVGRVVLQLDTVPADTTGTLTPTTSGASVTISTTAIGQNAKLSFSGTTGQRISILAIAITGGWSGSNVFLSMANSGRCRCRRYRL